jgi:hypothetical protein
MYRNLVVPNNSRVFQAFGGGTLHYCGNAAHQLDNFLQTKGLTGINCFCMGDFQQLVKMQAMFGAEVAIMACDFAPLGPDVYYAELFQAISPRGIIVARYIVATFALDQGKYQLCTRNPNELAERVWQAIQDNLPTK